MSLPWHIPLENAPKYKCPPYFTTSRKHYSNLDLNKPPCVEIQTGLMCDIGCMNKDPKSIQRLIAAGMTIARVNVKEMDPELSHQLIQSIRTAVYNYSIELNYIYPLAVLADVRGPSIATGNLKTGAGTTVELVEYSAIKLTQDPEWLECGTADCLYVGWDNLTDLQKDDMVYIDSLNATKIKLTVDEVGQNFLDCIVVIGGVIGNKMPVRLTHVPIDIRKAESDGSIVCDSEDDGPASKLDLIEQQLGWAMGSDVDGILLANTQGVVDIKDIKQSLREKNKQMLVIAGIETAVAINNIDEIIYEADGIFFDRCNIVSEIPLEKIFVAQKMIVAKCNQVGKPTICHAVINELIPNLSVFDIANLVLDGCDVLYLEMDYNSPESGNNTDYDPIRMAEHCIAASGVICRQAESIEWRPYTYGNMDLMTRKLKNPLQVVCVNAVELAARAQAVIIVCLTNSGRTAKNLSFARPSCPILAITRVCHTARSLRFWRGVRSLHYFADPKSTHMGEVEARIYASLTYCKLKELMKAGDPYVVVFGSRKDVGYCDSVKLLYAANKDTVYINP